MGPMVMVGVTAVGMTDMTEVGTIVADTIGAITVVEVVDATGAEHA